MCLRLYHFHKLWLQIKLEFFFPAISKLQVKRTLLVCGERVAVAMILQLLAELHDVSPFHKAFTTKQKIDSKWHIDTTRSFRITRTHTPAEGVNNLVEQCVLNWGVLRFCWFEQHGVQHRGAGEQAKNRDINMMGGFHLISGTVCSQFWFLSVSY